MTYTVTFSEDMDAGTVSAADFGNEGTATLSYRRGLGNLAGGLHGFGHACQHGNTPTSHPAGAVLTDVAGNPLDTSSALLDDTILTVEPALTPGVYTWTGGAGSGSNWWNPATGTPTVCRQ